MADANTVAIVAVITSSVVALTASGVQAAIAYFDRRDRRKVQVQELAWADKSAASRSATEVAMAVQAALE